MQTPQSTTKMVAKPDEPVKMVRIKALRAIKPTSLKGEMLAPGDEAEVTEAEAKDYCTPIQGFADHEGYVPTKQSKTQEIYRAERVRL